MGRRSTRSSVGAQQRSLRESSVMIVADKPTVILTPVSIVRLYYFTSVKERAVLLGGIIACIGAAVAAGVLDTVIAELMEKLVVALKFHDCKQNWTVDHNIEEQIYTDIRYSKTVNIGLLGLMHLICTYLFVTSFEYVAEKQSYRIKINYFLALFRQEPGWHRMLKEEHNLHPANIILEEADKIREATGEKMAFALYVLVSTLFAVGNALHHSFKLAIVVSLAPPIVVIFISVLIYKLGAYCGRREALQFAKADALAQEIFRNLKTVHAYYGYQREIKNFNTRIDKKSSGWMNRMLVTAIGSGFLWILNFNVFALTLWYGSTKIFEQDFCHSTSVYGGEYTVKDLLVCFRTVVTTLEICQYFSFVEVLNESRRAGRFIYAVCKRVPVIDPYSTGGLQLQTRLRGRIEFQSVSFRFSKSEDWDVNDVELKIYPAVFCFIGASDSGVDAILQLIMRFYDPQKGSVLIDGVDAREYNLRWLRSQIGMIDHEPVIFNGTVLENVQMGKPGATIEEVESACKTAYAHEFIKKLPVGYNTLVGDDSEVVLSFVQRQKIAVARAIVRKPAILIFDEPTNPVESESQFKLHQNLIQTRKGLTTIFAAHLLPTMKSADVLVVMEKGRIVESGSNSELLAKRGSYFLLHERLIGDYDAKEININVNLAKSSTTFKKPTGNTPKMSEVINKIVKIKKQHKLSIVRGGFLQLAFREYNSKWYLLLGGTLTVLLLGTITPAYAVVFDQGLGVFILSDTKTAQRLINFYAVVVVILGVLAGLAMTIQLICFSFYGNSLNIAIHKRIFAILVRREITAVDNPGRVLRNMYDELVSDVENVEASVAISLAVVIQALSTFITAITITFLHSKILGLCTLIFGVATVISILLTVKVVQSQHDQEHTVDAEFSKYVNDTCQNFHAVALLGAEALFVERFKKLLEPTHKKAVKLCHFSGLIQAFSISSIYVTIAVLIYNGVHLIEHHELEFGQLFTAGELMTWCVLIIGQALAYVGSFSNSNVSASRVLNVLKDQQEYNRQKHKSITFTREPEGPPGYVNFRHVKFHSPAAEHNLHDVNFVVTPGQHIAIVGTEEGGKAAIFPLILGMYRPMSGQVVVNGYDTSEWDVKALRSKLSIVYSDLRLFSRTVEDNIAYGNHFRPVITKRDVRKAAQTARIDDYIVNELPEGYNTLLGEDGQKLTSTSVRLILTARAMLKHPVILLIDETFCTDECDNDTTSRFSLASIRQEIIPRNLDYPMTVICCASRLDSIRHYDKIFVLNHGVVAENGTHDELLSLKGFYYKLWHLQHLGYNKQSRSRSKIK